MLSPSQLQAVEALARELNHSQRAWVSGYLAGMQHAAAVPAAAAPAATVLYGSQTGNGKAVAEALVLALREERVAVRMVSMADYKTAQLKKEKLLFVVVSTHGEGEPPDAAAGFMEFLLGTRAPTLAELRYVLLALGDSSYENFCQTGRDMHRRLGELGANAVLEPVECDVDYDVPAAAWQQRVGEICKQQAPAADVVPMLNGSGAAAAVPATYNRTRPFAATVLENIALTAPPRQTRHIELSLAGSDLRHRPGDSLGIMPENSPVLAERIAAQLGLSWKEEVTVDGETAAARDWLTARLDIAQPTVRALARFAECANAPRLDALVADKPAVQRYVRGRDWSEVFVDFPPPAAAGASAVLACMRRLTPRLYSLASAFCAREDEAHLLIGLDEYTTADGDVRRGLCSDYLTRLRPGARVRVYVQENEDFRPPADGRTPMIMIGAGTGVAPFRAFLEAREEDGGGDSWLFFGERHRRDDFYYQVEWQRWLADGVLTRLDVAFSRDGAEKIYVQDKLRRHAAEVRRWLENGACLYVCGDEQGMAKGVHAALVDILAGQNGGDGEARLQTLQSEGRYRRDVY